VRVALLQEQKKRSEEILSARRVMKSGHRLSVEGQHLLTTETVYEKVKNAEIMIEERKKKTGGRGRKKSNQVEENLSEDEPEIEIYDSIEVEPYPS
jgi:hypothetical protein